MISPGSHSWWSAGLYEAPSDLGLEPMPLTTELSCPFASRHHGCSSAMNKQSPCPHGTYILAEGDTDLT